MNTEAVRVIAKKHAEAWYRADRAGDFPNLIFSIFDAINEALGPRDPLDVLRDEQAAAVMPQIGPLLDAWAGCYNDLKSEIEDQVPTLYRVLNRISNAVETA